MDEPADPLRAHELTRRCRRVLAWHASWSPRVPSRRSASVLPRRGGVSGRWLPGRRSGGDLRAGASPCVP